MLYDDAFLRIRSLLTLLACLLGRKGKQDGAVPDRPPHPGADPEEENSKPRWVLAFCSVPPPEPIYDKSFCDIYRRGMYVCMGEGRGMPDAARVNHDQDEPFLISSVCTIHSAAKPSAVGDSHRHGSGRFPSPVSLRQMHRYHTYIPTYIVHSNSVGSKSSKATLNFLFFSPLSCLRAGSSPSFRSQ